LFGGLVVWLFGFMEIAYKSVSLLVVWSFGIMTSILLVFMDKYSIKPNNQTTKILRQNFSYFGFQNLFVFCFLILIFTAIHMQICQN
jgi:hypothetical protein